MAYYLSVGDVPPKRHTQHRDPDGNLYREELMGEEGFSSDSSLLYHRGVPSAIVDSQVWELPDQTRTPNHPLKPRHLKLHALFPEGDATGRRRSPAGGWCSATTTCGSRTSSPGRRRVAVLPQRDRRRVRVRRVRAGVVETVFGAVTYRTGDYVIVPRATTHRWLPSEPSRLYPIEANSHIHPPKRYLSRFGQFLEHAPYCERDLHGRRTSRWWSTGEDVEVLVKHRTSGGRSSAPG